MSFEDYQSAVPSLFPDLNVQVEETVVDQAGAPSPPRKGFADIIEYHKETQHGREVEIIPTDRYVPKFASKKTKKIPKYDDYAVVLRRTWELQGNVSVLIRLELEIQSEQLCKAFREIAVNTYEDTDLKAFPIKLKAPFTELFFYRNEIKSLAEDENSDPELRFEAKALHNFVYDKGLMSSIIQDHEQYSKEGSVVNDILWTIYPPNSMVVISAEMIRECWIVRNVSLKYYRHHFWEIVGFRIGFGGSSVGLVRQSFTLPLTGMQVCKISDLPVVPILDWPNLGMLKDSLMNRSMRLQKVLGKDMSLFSCQTYKGAALTRNFSAYSAGFKAWRYAKQIDERVVVDFKIYADQNPSEITSIEDIQKKPEIDNSKARENPNGRFFIEGQTAAKHNQSGWESDTNEKGVVFNPENTEDPMRFQVSGGSREVEETPKPDIEDLLSLSKAVRIRFGVSDEDFQLLFPALVPGFGLKEKKWGWLFSDELRDVLWNKFAFESLQLEQVTKNLVQALVKGHKSNSAAFDDVMPGKGQGLIFLLHGKPGLGKTLTAESVADYLQRPLYSISGGELSTNVTILERKLTEIFDLTKRWDAVSLLDEADVLLCKRNSAEIDRNAIVAVFLRKIEYFQGVLFLTTNRKEDFDDAFKSRIHVTISYPDLAEEARSGIWRSLIEANKNVVRDNSWTDDIFSELGKLDLNGRTIKNILRTAVAYANADNAPLGFRHVLAIVKTELKDDEGFDADALRKRENEKKVQTANALQHLEYLNG